jgi:3-hydroxybutyryl-CoA dehydratase
MSSMDHPVFYIGMQETFSKVITDGEAALFAGLIGDNLPKMISGVDITPLQDQNHYISQFLMTGIISGILHNRVITKPSQFVSTQFEFLAPIKIGVPILVVIEVTAFDPQKHLTTFKADCYDQNKNQITTGQVVMLVSE